MLKTLFYPTLVLTIVEAQLFSWALTSKNWIFVLFLGILLINNLRSVYKLEKIARKNGLI